MKVVIPYVEQVRDGPPDLHLTGIQPQTLAAVKAECPNPRPELLFWPTDYHDLIERLWGEGGTFVNVEADIVPWHGALRQLWLCQQDWCAFPYPMGAAGEHWSLGCTKFSARLIARCPEALRLAGRIDDDGVALRKHWIRLDTRLMRILTQAYRETPHIHGPAVGHLNPAQEIKSASSPP